MKPFGCRSLQRRLCRGLMALMLAVVGGCGGPTNLSTVTGMVSLDGDPVLTGTVIASGIGLDNKMRLFQAAIQSDGTYRLEKVPYGTTLRFAITSLPPGKAPMGTADTLETLEIRRKGTDQQAGGESERRTIPVIYRDPASSGLSAEVWDELVTCDLELKGGRTSP